MDTREIDFEVVEDAAAIAKFGVIIKQVKAFTCTSRGQAARLKSRRTERFFLLNQ